LSLLLPLNPACLAEKQQILFFLSLVEPEQGSNPQSTTLEASTLTITPPMWQYVYPPTVVLMMTHKATSKACPSLLTNET
jgi:hypothetical protein